MLEVVHSLFLYRLCARSIFCDFRYCCGRSFSLIWSLQVSQHSWDLCGIGMMSSLPDHAAPLNKYFQLLHRRKSSKVQSGTLWLSQGCQLSPGSPSVGFGTSDCPLADSELYMSLVREIEAPVPSLSGDTIILLSCWLLGLPGSSHGGHGANPSDFWPIRPTAQCWSQGCSATQVLWS